MWGSRCEEIKGDYDVCHMGCINLCIDTSKKYKDLLKSSIYSVVCSNISVDLGSNWCLAAGKIDFTALIPVLCACRCWACSVLAWCCAGGATTRLTSCWSQPTAMHEECSQPANKALRNSTGASPDMSTVDISCSYISSSTPCTIHDEVAEHWRFGWVGASRENHLFIDMLSKFLLLFNVYSFVTNTEIFTKAKAVYG